jgi:hypothetical protein
MPGTSMKSCLLALAAALLPACAWAMAETPRDYQEQLDCAAARNQQLLNAPMRADPRANVWVLEVLDAMGMNRHCAQLDEHLFANYLERQAANDVVQEQIGEPATVREAIEWENKAEFAGTPEEVAHDRTHIHSRLLSRGFAVEAWAPPAAGVPMLRNAPHLKMIAPGLWVDTAQPGASAMPIQVSLDFVNKAARSLEWDAHTLYMRSTPEGRYDLMFSCMRDGLEGPRFTINRATVAPGGRVHVTCQLANSGLPPGSLDAAWLERVLTGDRQWFVEGPPSEGGTYDYKTTLAQLAGTQSHAAAAPYLGSLSCNQSASCLTAKVAWLQSPLYQWLRDGLPAFAAGIVLTGLLGFGQRARMVRVAPFVAVAVGVAYAAIVGWLMLKGYGLGAVAIAFSGGRMAAGAIAGAIATRLWAGRARPPQVD